MNSCRFMEAYRRSWRAWQLLPSAAKLWCWSAACSCLVFDGGMAQRSSSSCSPLNGCCIFVAETSASLGGSLLNELKVWCRRSANPNGLRMAWKPYFIQAYSASKSCYDLAWSNCFRKFFASSSTWLNIHASASSAGGFRSTWYCLAARFSPTSTISSGSYLSAPAFSPLDYRQYS